MKSVLVVGIGRFGFHIAKKFAELGNQVLAVDISEERVNEILPHVLNAQIGDCTKEEVLEALGVSNFDVCVVALSELGTALEITYYLKELGAPFVLSRANSESQAKFLLRSGADEVVYPEMQTALRMAVKHSAHRLFDYIEVTAGYSVSEVPVPKAWVGQTIDHVAVRTKYHVNILATKGGGSWQVQIKPTHVFGTDEHLLVFGQKEDIIKLSDRL